MKFERSASGIASTALGILVSLALLAVSVALACRIVLLHYNEDAQAYSQELWQEFKRVEHGVRKDDSCANIERNLNAVGCFEASRADILAQGSTLENEKRHF